MSESLYIFVTGVVGRAMGSGKFEGDDIDMLTQRALDAFRAHLELKVSQSAPPLNQPSSRSPGPQRPDWQGATAGGNGVPPESKAFSIWASDKSYIFGRNDATWADLLGEAQEGNLGTRALLEKAAKASIGEDPQWHKNNARRIGRAKACLAMLESRPAT